MPPPGPSKPLIDAHCHVFNASDLPVTRFVRVVFLSVHPKLSTSTLDIKDPDALDGLIALFTFILGRTGAPSAEAEIKVLNKTQAKKLANSRSAENQDLVIDAAASFLSQSQVGVADDISPKAFAAVRRALRTSAGIMSAPVSDEPLPHDQAKEIAKAAYKSKFDLGRYLRWFTLFSHYRHELSAQLSDDHRALGFDAQLLCPATIDYDHWLREDVTKSPLPKQIEVMGALARRKDGPAVHGYVAYDPLRRVYFKLGKFKDYDPLEVVRTAVRDHGFVGVKLYPPMGFRATGNSSDPCQNYPDAVVQELFANEPQSPATVNCKPRPHPGALRISSMLDQAMQDLFAVCVKEDAAILAHANDSNGANDGFSHRADPAFWIDAFRAYPALRVCLAHFGHFDATSSGAPEGSKPPDSCWEWELGRFFKANPGANVYADCSYFTGTDVKEDVELAARLRSWVLQFDPDCKHLVFGTDWTMTGLDSGYGRYTQNVYEFFKQACGFDEAQMARLMWGNAAKLLGVRRGDTPRVRLEAFYLKHGVPLTKLPAFV